MPLPQRNFFEVNSKAIIGHCQLDVYH